MRKLFAFLSASVVFVLAAAPVAASEHSDHNDGRVGYLALGDSVPFGFDPRADASDADNFIGYPEIVAKRLNLEHANASCPGEATGGFLSLTGTDNVCRPYRFYLHNPLHVDYSGTQVDYATAYLRSHPGTRLVTLTLGANDIFRYQKDCTPKPTCLTDAGAIGGVLAVMYANLTTIFAAIRATGYSGLIVAVTYYALDYSDTRGTVGLNSPMVAAATAHGALVASGLDAWAATAHGGSSCTAGLLIRLPDRTCDVHPSPLGRNLLAAKVMSTIAASCPAHNAKRCLGSDSDSDSD
ncbi:MAG TPA: SGNH/GDSL hydrolase family protein [Candidatus Dormibacteraeota bacterium]|nr:SGNH/GDSL hydrolase family protein [Candidatus Dormibacteraeota bacterium]